MTWERALEADARLAARNALLIRAALRQQFDAERAFEGYARTMPDTNLSLPQQRLRARAWAIVNIRPNLEPLKEVLTRIWAQGYALGDTAAREALLEAKEAQKAEAQGIVDWSKWKPGDAVAALLLKPPRAFQQLLQSQGITFKGFSDTTLTDIGNAIGEAIHLGLDAKQSAKLITNHVASPARALSIAITEQNRAISQATVNRYKEAGLQQHQWLVFQPCAICATNANQIVNIGTPFPSGDLQPPAHPHCRCALAPVIPGFEEQQLVPGGQIITPPISTQPFTPPTAKPATMQEAITAQLQASQRRKETPLVPGQWRTLSPDEIREEMITGYMVSSGKARESVEYFINSKRINKADLALLDGGIVYANGPVRVQFFSTGKKVKEKTRLKLLEEVEELQTIAPKSEMTIIVASERGNAYGSALLGDAKIWLKPSLVNSDNPLIAELGFKMPVIAKVPHRQYTLTHEWGHTIDTGGSFDLGTSIQSAITKKRIEELKKEYANVPEAVVSGYSNKNTKEFYAEMYAEYVLTKGTTKNPLVLAMAKEFGWNKPRGVSASGPAFGVAEPSAKAPGNYVTAKKTKEHWTNDTLIDMYGMNAKGTIDFGSYNRDGQNLFLRNILQEQGYNGLPRVVSAQEFQKYVDQGSIPLFRGIAGTTPGQVDDYITQYLSGTTPFVGKGMFGDGTYFGNKRSVGEKFAKEDRNGNPIPHGKIMEATLDPRAKIITMEEINDYTRKNRTELYDYPQDYYEDPSAIAASLGYDAIKITNPKVNFVDPTAQAVDADYYIVLNRTAVIVKEMP
jgi:hypothetical protein